MKDYAISTDTRTVTAAPGQTRASGCFIRIAREKTPVRSRHRGGTGQLLGAGEDHCIAFFKYAVAKETMRYNQDKARHRWIAVTRHVSVQEVIETDTLESSDTAKREVQAEYITDKQESKTECDREAARRRCVYAVGYRAFTGRSRGGPEGASPSVRCDQSYD